MDSLKITVFFFLNDDNGNNNDMNILVIYKKGMVQVRDNAQCVRKITCLYTHAKMSSVLLFWNPVAEAVT